MIAGGPGVLVVRKDSPHKTLRGPDCSGEKAKPGAIVPSDQAGNRLVQPLEQRAVPFRWGGNPGPSTFRTRARAPALGGPARWPPRFSTWSIFPAMQKLIDSGEPARAGSHHAAALHAGAPDIPTMIEGWSGGLRPLPPGSALMTGGWRFPRTSSTSFTRPWRRVCVIPPVTARHQQAWAWYPVDKPPGGSSLHSWWPRRAKYKKLVQADRDHRQSAMTMKIWHQSFTVARGSAGLPGGPCAGAYPQGGAPTDTEVG